MYEALHDDKALHDRVRNMIRNTLESREKAQLPTSRGDGLVHISLARPNTVGTVSSGSATSTGSSNTIETRDLAQLVAQGLEVRTTLMIKKVPRKYTLAMLRKEIDGVLASQGCYDLLYLPVDSAKMTNRGYAFINLTSPVHVVPFVGAFADRAWKELNRRNKTALIQWAYVQGKEATLAHINSDIISPDNNN